MCISRFMLGTTYEYRISCLGLGILKFRYENCDGHLPVRLHQLRITRNKDRTGDYGR
jgi:hypothetical protein